MSGGKPILETLFERLHNGQLIFVPRLVTDARAQFVEYHKQLNSEERRKVSHGVDLPIQK